MARGKRWTEQEVSYLRQYIPVRGAKWVAKQLPGRTREAVQCKAWSLGITLGETYAYRRGKIVFVSDIAAELGIPISSVHTAIKRADVEIAEFGTNGNSRGRRIAVPREWAEAFIAEQRELRDNAENYAHWWSVDKAAALLGLNRTTVHYWIAKPERTKYLVVNPRAVLAGDGDSPRYHLFCPEDIEAIKNQLEEHRALVKTWVPLKHLQLEAGVHISGVHRMAKKLGNPQRLFARGNWRWHVSPEDAQKLRDYYGVRKAA